MPSGKGLARSLCRAFYYLSGHFLHLFLPGFLYFLQHFFLWQIKASWNQSDQSDGRVNTGTPIRIHPVQFGGGLDFPAFIW